MPIPAFNEYGLLPEGIHDCTLEEAKNRFGRFQQSDRRPQLWEKFLLFFQDGEASGLIEAILMDGSFITASSEPNDIDLIIVLPSTHDLLAELTPARYNLLNQKHVRKRFNLDIIVVKNASENLESAIAFFQQVRQKPGLRKGILRILL
jgi:hypothetical protein